MIINPQIKILLILISSFFYTMSLHAQNDTNSVHNKTTSIVVAGHARFSILTTHIIRLEYDSRQRFVNEPSFVVINRNLPTIPFKKSLKGKWLIIKTDQMELKYKTGSGKFNDENLQITYKQDPTHTIVWNPGMKNNENLKGTFRTLDGMNGDTNESEKIPTSFVECALFHFSTNCLKFVVSELLEYFAFMELLQPIVRRKKNKMLLNLIIFFINE